MKLSEFLEYAGRLPRGERAMGRLKPCPFCGGEAVLCIQTLNDSLVFVRCHDCNSKSTQYIAEIGNEDESAYEAIEAWNRRIDDGILST